MSLTAGTGSAWRGSITSAIVALAATGVVGCGGTEPGPPQVKAEAISGAGQVGAAGVTLPESLVVRVTHAGSPVPGANVEWTIVSGGGSIAPQVMTDAQGLAAAAYTPADEGPWLVQVTVLTVPDPIIASQPFGIAEFNGTAGMLAAPAVGVTFLVPQVYGLHDTYVRDGIAFLCAWNTGIIILDVGNGIKGGTPLAPVPVDTFRTGAAPLPESRAHNAWWFHNPVTRENRYLFVGQEGPGVIGSASSGDIHVLDVSDLTNPREVAFFHLEGAGVHNFWMDEGAQVLYAAYYNGGVIALDVSGVLAGDLGNRLIANTKPGGAGNTYVWGVTAANGHLYAIDMLSGLWQLNPLTLAPVAGGNNVPDRWSSDLWIPEGGEYAYTGTWGGTSRNGNTGNAVKIWHLETSGAPTLVDSLKFADVGTVSDLEVSPDGSLLMVSTERSFSSVGLYFYALNDPRKPILIGRALVTSGVHTASFAEIGGHLYAFAARNPMNSGLLVYDVTDLRQ